MEGGESRLVIEVAIFGHTLLKVDRLKVCVCQFVVGVAIPKEVDLPLAHTALGIEDEVELRTVAKEIFCVSVGYGTQLR